MPYKTGSLKGQLTTAEIRKLVRAHNKLSKITIPSKSSRDDILSIIDKAGFKVNHEAQTLQQMKSVKKTITLEGAKEATKVVPKTAQQKQQAKDKKDKKQKAVKDREGELIKAGAIIGKTRAKAQIKKEKPKPKPKGVSIGTGTDPAPEPAKKPAKKVDKGFKVERFERTKMINAVSDEMGKKFDPFKVLGIKARDETPEIVKKRCKELRLKEHPDKGGDKAKFDLIQKACKILLDTQTITKKSGN